MSKCLAVVTENGFEPTAQANNTLTAIKLALLQKQAMQNFAPNDEIWITESGDWEVPYDGIYEVLTIGGGDGGLANNAIVFGGISGMYRFGTTYFNKNQILSITIGAGGEGATTNFSDSLRWGGETFIEGITLEPTDTVNKSTRLLGTSQTYIANSNNIFIACGGGFGGGMFGSIADFTNTDTLHAIWYGGGGGAKADSTHKIAGDGYQGAVRFRFFNPEKASLPTINDADLIPYVELLNRLEAIEAQLNINS